MSATKIERATVFGIGALLGLTGPQYAKRYPRVMRIGEPIDGNRRLPVVALSPVMFKPGEDVLELPAPALPLASLASVPLYAPHRAGIAATPSTTRLYYGGRRIVAYAATAPAAFGIGAFLALTPPQLRAAGAAAGRVPEGPKFEGRTAVVLLSPLTLPPGEVVFVLAGGHVEEIQMSGLPRPRRRA